MTKDNKRTISPVPGRCGSISTAVRPLCFIAVLFLLLVPGRELRAWTAKTAEEILNSVAARLPDPLRQALALYPDQVRLGFQSANPWAAVDPAKPQSDPRRELMGRIILDMNRFSVIQSQNQGDAAMANQFGVLARDILALDSLEILGVQTSPQASDPIVKQADEEFGARTLEQRASISQPTLESDPVKRLWTAYNTSLNLALEARNAYQTGAGFSGANRALRTLYDRAVIDLGDLAATAWAVANQRLAGPMGAKSRIQDIGKQIEAIRSIIQHYSSSTQLAPVPGPKPPTPPQPPSVQMEQPEKKENE